MGKAIGWRFLVFGHQNVFVANCSASAYWTCCHTLEYHCCCFLLMRSHLSPAKQIECFGYVTDNIFRKITSKYYVWISPFRWEGYFVSKEVCIVKVLPTDMSLLLHLLYVFELFSTYMNKYKSWEKFDSFKLLMESVNKFLFCWHTFSTYLESCQLGPFHVFKSIWLVEGYVKWWIVGSCISSVPKILVCPTGPGCSGTFAWGVTGQKPPD